MLDRAIRFSTLEALCRELACQPGDLLEWRGEPAARAFEDGDSLAGIVLSP